MLFSSLLSFSLLAVSSTLLYSASPAGALHIEARSKNALMVRHHAHAQNLSVVKPPRKRANTGKCKPRSSSSAAALATSTSHSSASSPAQTAKSSGSGSSSGSTGSSGSAKTSSSSSSSGGSGSSSSSGGSSGGSSGAKVGLAWPNGPDGLNPFVTPSVKWIYTWSEYIPPAAKGLGLTGCPMLWGNGEDKVSAFTKTVVEGYANCVLGFNEPNQVGQSNMSPGDGAAAWKQYIQPLKNKGYQLITPATSSAPSGFTWMQDFFAACDGCTYDALALHYYDVSAQGMIDYIQKFYDAFKLPIYVTEFACQNFNGGPQSTQDEVDAFMATVTKWMQEQDFVVGYFAFGAMQNLQGVNTDNSLMLANGQPSPLGYSYLNP